VEPDDTGPGHTDVEGNEMADMQAKAVGRSEWVGRNNHLVATISLTHLQRKITEWTRQETKEWIDLRRGKRQEYLLPREPGLRSRLQRERKAVAARFYQLL